MVVWDPELLQPHVSEPMDYKAEKAEEVSHSVLASAVTAL